MNSETFHDSCVKIFNVQGLNLSCSSCFLQAPSVQRKYNLCISSPVRFYIYLKCNSIEKNSTDVSEKKKKKKKKKKMLGIHV